MNTTLRAYIDLTRLQLFFAWPLLFCSGYLLATTVYGNFAVVDIVRVALIGFFGFEAGFVLNDYVDRQYDKRQAAARSSGCCASRARRAGSPRRCWSGSPSYRCSVGCSEVCGGRSSDRGGASSEGWSRALAQRPDRRARRRARGLRHHALECPRGESCGRRAHHHRADLQGQGGRHLQVIAAQAGVDQRRIAEWNQLASPDRIFVGQVLRLAPPGNGDTRVASRPAGAAGGSKAEDATPSDARPVPVQVRPAADHVRKVVGIDYVGIGTDFDGGGGVLGCDDVSGMIHVTEELIHRGYSDREIDKIWGGNFFRVFEKVIDLGRKIGRSTALKA